jgi:hypothetical protein|tara:strand:- start:7655 stop:7939 length:285 start_codon:yes stop_codon:yes gene_type:complete
MGIVEVDMYVNQFKVFFDKNPDDLTELIGDILVSDFYNEVKTQSSLNYENGDEVSLTQKQIINIVIKLKSPNKEIEDKVYNIFQNTNFGKICLN